MHEPPPSLCILIADDDEDMRAYLSGTLRRLGAARVLKAAGGREALHLALTPDLVISDRMMPDMGGDALCHALRADSATARIPVLIPVR